MTNLGKNLSVLIISEPEKDWQTFCTWYSVSKSLPESSIHIHSIRNGSTPFQLFQWAKKLGVPTVHHNAFCDEKIPNWLDAIEKSGFNGEILVLSPLTIVNSIDKNLFSLDLCIDKDAWFLRNQNIKDLFDKYFLESKEFPETKFCPQASESQNICDIFSCSKGCGRWKPSLRGCPLSDADGFVTNEMTVNELRVIELWKKACSLYSALI